MGVPTLTLAGRTLAQRLGAGIMGRWGSDWVAESEDEFVAIAERAAAHRTNSPACARACAGA
jgi:predicted O-linked N-acetylglucosamine transferase (SPINDLY family)